MNDDIERPYLKYFKKQGKCKIKYDSIITVENDRFGKDISYFMGIYNFNIIK